MPNKPTVFTWPGVVTIVVGNVHKETMGAWYSPRGNSNGTLRWTHRARALQYLAVVVLAVVVVVADVMGDCGRCDCGTSRCDCGMWCRCSMWCDCGTRL